MKQLFAFPIVRLLLIVLLFAVLAAPIVFAAGRPQGIWIGVAVSWLLLAALLLAVAIVERIAAGKRLAAIGLRRRHALRELLLGMLLGTVLFSLVVAEMAFAGFYRVAAVHASRDLVPAALLLLSGAAAEELLFRGVLFRLVEEWTGTWIALLVSAIVFGLAHAANPAATWLSSAAIALEAGILLGAAFVVTRNLWLPIGLHFGWNFCEGPVYGSQVSGHGFGTSLFAAHVTGPALFTGGSFGPEAGVFAILTCVIAAAALLTYAVRASLTLAPAWRNRARAAA